MSPREGGGGRRRRPPRPAWPHRTCSKCGAPRRPLWQIAQDCERLSQEAQPLAAAEERRPPALWFLIGRLEEALHLHGKELLGCRACGLRWPDVQPTPPGLPKVPWRLHQVIEVCSYGGALAEGRIERISASGRIRVGSAWYNPAGRSCRGFVRAKAEAAATAAPAAAAPEEA